ncbi:NAD(P)/FAD-dependent oxidoreductase [Nitrospirillum sp. BR 11752]|uniref:NAD(P)/FAD-dependent oxidoreductase n=1 Tax=Nitrospirillum sp. BR 11752 TaxID=3104293 RepID=UPI002EC20C7C|nr:NAD(P)/FAD-dependent oxidoreductase [Nitrospirillum sp. BR 11752]
MRDAEKGEPGMAVTDTDFDGIVVGAGAVGLACGRALAARGLTVAVLEAEEAIGQGVSSRNSEVVHGGLYYPTGSLRARLCVAGRRLLYPFLDVHGVTYDKCGKLVVATEAAELSRLEGILRQAQTNDVEGMRWLSAAEVHALEPELRAVAALLSPESGIFDSHGYMVALRGEIEGGGGAVVTGTPVLGVTPLDGGGFSVRTGGRDPYAVTTRLLVTAPGLSAQDVAASIEGFPANLIPKAHYGKGSYFALQGGAPFRRLVYPPPIPGALGVHYRRDLGGQGRFGPDLEYVDAPDYRVDPGRADGFYRYIRRFWPGLPDGALVPDYAGVRPKIHGPGEAQPDFRLDGADVHGLPGLVALFGIESPGLTSSLAIGEAVADILGV